MWPVSIVDRNRAWAGPSSFAHKPRLLLVLFLPAFNQLADKKISIPFFNFMKAISCRFYKMIPVSIVSVWKAPKDAAFIIAVECGCLISVSNSAVWYVLFFYPRKICYLYYLWYKSCLSDLHRFILSSQSSLFQLPFVPTNNYW